VNDVLSDSACGWRIGDDGDDRTRLNALNRGLDRRVSQEAVAATEAGSMVPRISAERTIEQGRATDGDSLSAVPPAARFGHTLRSNRPDRLFSPAASRHLRPDSPASLPVPHSTARYMLPCFRWLFAARSCRHSAIITRSHPPLRDVVIQCRDPISRKRYPIQRFRMEVSANRRSIDIGETFVCHQKQNVHVPAPQGVAMALAFHLRRPPDWMMRQSKPFIFAGAF
jgi:hypothetical protein